MRTNDGEKIEVEMTVGRLDNILIGLASNVAFSQHEYEKTIAWLQTEPPREAVEKQIERAEERIREAFASAAGHFGQG